MEYESLRGDRAFGDVQRRGSRRQGKMLALRAYANGLDRNRYGFAISKKVGCAVVRNRIRRRLRASLSDLRPASGWDLVMTARAESASAPYSLLRDDLRNLLQSSGVALNGTSG